MSSKMRYRLALDLGTTSIGWAMLRLDQQDRPCAVIRAGVRIFNDGRVPKTGRLWQYNDAWRDSNAGRVIAVLGARTN